jgi:hypothetical protein
MSKVAIERPVRLDLSAESAAIQQCFSLTTNQRNEHAVSYQGCFRYLLSLTLPDNASFRVHAFSIEYFMITSGKVNRIKNI